LLHGFEPRGCHVEDAFGLVLANVRATGEPGDQQPFVLQPIKGDVHGAPGDWTLTSSLNLVPDRGPVCELAALDDVENSEENHEFKFTEGRLGGRGHDVYIVVEVTTM
jgi:hypothetical protein